MMGKVVKKVGKEIKDVETLASGQSRGERAEVLGEGGEASGSRGVRENPAFTGLEEALVEIRKVGGEADIDVGWGTGSERGGEEGVKVGDFGMRNRSRIRPQQRSGE